MYALLQIANIFTCISFYLLFLLILFQLFHLLIKNSKIWEENVSSFSTHGNECLERLDHLPKAYS